MQHDGFDEVGCGKELTPWAAGLVWEPGCRKGQTQLQRIRGDVFIAMDGLCGLNEDKGIIGRRRPCLLA